MEVSSFQHQLHVSANHAKQQSQSHQSAHVDVLNNFADVRSLGGVFCFMGVHQCHGSDKEFFYMIPLPVACVKIRN